MQRTTLSRTTIASLALLATLGVIAFLYFAASVFITILSSALIALALEPFVQFFCRKAKIGRRGSSMVVGVFAVAFPLRVFLPPLPERDAVFHRPADPRRADPERPAGAGHHRPDLSDHGDLERGGKAHRPAARVGRREGDRSRPPRGELLVRCRLPRPRVGP